MATAAATHLANRLHAALPQTQCRRCGYDDCRAYAQAMAEGSAPINRCPPGGASGVARLAALIGQAKSQALPVLDPSCGSEAPRTVVFIDEAWCIGCTLCIKACPTDAIIGTHKRMHTVVEDWCTGCDLCLPVCPVDCIITTNASGTATGWNAWTPAQAAQALYRYENRSERLKRDERERQEKHIKTAENKLADLPAHSQITDPALLDRKRALVNAALERARARLKAPD